MFLAGFGRFLNNEMAQFNETTQQDDLIEHISEEKDEEQQIFRNTLDALGATNLYDDEETIRALWTKLRETDPSLLRQFEGFIGKVTEEIKRSKSDHRSIEAALQSKSSVHES